MATSTAQTIPLTEVYDYYLGSGDPATATSSKGLSGRQVKVTLQYDKALTIAPDAVVWAGQSPVYAALTDANGFWHVYLVPNNKISPANTYYVVAIDGGPTYKIQVTDVAVPASGWQSSAPGILLDIPSALAPTTSTVGAITATGLITAQAGINVTAGGVSIAAGGGSVVGGLTVDSITYSVAVSRLIPGGTSFSVRDTGNANDNLLVTNAGNATVRGSLTITTGPLNVSAGGAAITGNSTVTGTLTVSSTLTVSGGGVAVTGNSTVTGTLTVSGLVTAQAALTVSAGNLNVTAGNLVFAAASAKIIPGATSLLVRNTADSANNLQITDAGLATLRNALSVPPSAGGAVAATSYGSVPVKIDEKTGASATYDFAGIPTGFRALRLVFKLRDTSALAALNICSVRFNGIATATYDSMDAVLRGATAVANPIEADAATAATFSGLIAGGGLADANAYCYGEAIIPAYADANNEKSGVTTAAAKVAAGANSIFGEICHFGSRATTAINQITLIPNTGFSANSWCELWGYP